MIFLVATHNLALGVGVGVLLSGIFRVTVSDAEGRRTYLVEGQLFFASAQDLLDRMGFRAPPPKAVLDVSRAHIWDLTGVGAIDTAVLKFRRTGAEFKVIGLNEASASIMDRLAVHDQPGAMERLLGH